ncbi:MAG: hypothetical protein MI757_00305 [Pirellulales bacterium]|nr:hypothetical protein [Pirellulales bacterium]
MLQPWPFSWTTRSLETGQITLNGSIPGLSQPGPEFMKTVFGMEVGDVAIAVNHPERIVYVVRLDSLDPDSKTLDERFTRAVPNQLAGTAGFDLRDQQQALGEALRKEFDLEWAVPEDAEARR